jgi:PAS domain S-box-containing protein
MPDNLAADNTKSSPDDLRSRARERMRATRTEIQALTEEEALALIYDLQLHQAELEIVNEDLLETQQKLSQAYRDYAGLYDGAPMAYLTLDENYAVRRANKAAAALFARDLDGVNISGLAAPEDRDRCYLYFRNIKPETAGTAEIRFSRGNGDIFWGRLSAIRIDAGASEGAGFRAAIMDITREKQIEKQLRSSEERYRLLYEESPIVNAIVLRDGTILDVNEYGLKGLGYKKEEVIGQPLSDFAIPEQRRFLNEQIQAGAQGALLPEFELSLYAKDGLVHHFLTKPGKAALSHGDMLDGFVCSALDITERKRGEQALLKSVEQLAAANKELESFSYSLSHDLRAPLRTMKGFSDILEEDYSNDLDAKGRDFLDRIAAGADRMNEIIDDMLSMAKISRHELRVTEIDLSLIAASVFDNLRQAEPERNVKVVIAGRMKAKGDVRLINLALSNLLENAWKYSGKIPDAAIEFGVAEINGERVYFVRDNGVGFDMGQAHRLFIPFQRLHSESQFPGTGVGLAIVKKVIQRHGGRIWAESEIGKGACFRFSLPAP